MVHITPVDHETAGMLTLTLTWNTVLLSIGGGARVKRFQFEKLPACSR